MPRESGRVRASGSAKSLTMAIAELGEDGICQVVLDHRITIHQHQSGAGRSQAAGDSQTQALSGSRNENCAVSQLHI